MKKLMLSLSVVCFSLVSFAQKKTDKIPEIVKTTFASSYPNATEVEWEKEGELFEVSFEQNEYDISLLYDAMGKVKEEEKEMAFDELPQAIQEYVNTNFKGKKIEEATKITDDQGVVTYEVEVKKKEYIFDSKGKLVK